jgi:hypothetical protein
MIFISLPFAASGEVIDPQRKSSLTLQYRYGEELFEGLFIRTYRVAKVSEKGEYRLHGAFAGYPVNIEGITSQTEWKRIATTLGAYVAADSIAETASGKTDKEGFVRFENLLPGMYLTLSVKSEKGNTITTFETFLTVIPYPGEGSYLYDVTAYPKCQQETVKPQEKVYKVVKQWKDGDYAHLRPKKVAVDILKDGVLYESTQLLAENNWAYSWTVQDDGSKWQAVERDIAEYYTVSVEEFDSTIIISNIYDHEEEPPKTGESTLPHVYLMLAGGLGCLMLLAAVWRKRVGV